MSVLITILLVILALVALLLIIAVFTKKSYTIERTITINKPVNEVFGYVRLLKNQDYFNKWVMVDPDKKKSYRGVDGTPGFVYAWNGNKQSGEGEQELTNIIEGQKVESEVRFIRPMTGVAKTFFNTEALAPNQTRVNWGMSSSMKYPMNIMLVLMSLEKMLGKDLEISMATLKNNLEKS